VENNLNITMIVSLTYMCFYFICYVCTQEDTLKHLNPNTKSPVKVFGNSLYVTSALHAIYCFHKYVRFNCGYWYQYAHNYVISRRGCVEGLCGGVVWSSYTKAHSRSVSEQQISIPNMYLC